MSVREIVEGSREELILENYKELILEIYKLEKIEKLRKDLLTSISQTLNDPNITDAKKVEDIKSFYDYSNKKLLQEQKENEK